MESQGDGGLPREAQGQPQLQVDGRHARCEEGEVNFAFLSYCRLRRQREYHEKDKLIYYQVNSSRSKRLELSEPFPS